MKPHPFLRTTLTLAAALLLAGHAFAQAAPADAASAPAAAKTTPARSKGASDKNASENSIGAANAQVDAAGGTPLKKRVKKSKVDKNVNRSYPPGPAMPSAGDSGDAPLKP